jgi:hypothetical protein
VLSAALAVGVLRVFASPAAGTSAGRIVAAGYTANGSNTDFALMRANPSRGPRSVDLPSGHRGDREVDALWDRRLREDVRFA